MRIRSVRIGSFGKYRDWIMDDIPDGLTLITGSNESGKTTLMEFMRSTMFPSSRRSYPVPAKTDSGSMEIETESGERMTIIREQRKVRELSGGKLPEEMFSMDSDTYRSIFAMDLNDLADANAISSERIRNRFLTIPGGEKVPQVIKDISSARTELMNEERITEKNLIGSLQSSIVSLDRRIAEAKDVDSEYDSYAAEMRSVNEELRRLTGMQEIVDRDRERWNMITSNIPNLERLNAMTERHEQIEYSRSLSDETQMRYAEAIRRAEILRSELEETEETDLMPPDKLEEVKDACSDLKAFRKGYDGMTDRIEHLKDSISEDEEFIESSGVRAELATPEKRKEMTELSKKAALPLIYMVLLISGVVVGAAAFFVNILLLAAGAVLMAAGLYGLVRTRTERKLERWMESEGYPEVKRDRIPSFIMKLEMVDAASQRIMSDRQDLDDIHADMSRMGSRLEDILHSLGTSVASMSMPELMDLSESVLSERIEEEEENIRIKERMESKRAELSDLMDISERIVSVYGGTDGFEKARNDRSELLTLDAEIRAARQTLISATGMSVEDLEAASKEEVRDTIDLKDEISQLNVRVGELKERMDRAVNSDTVNRLQTERNAKWAELTEKVREWGVLSLEESMIGMSCTELYSRMQPSVISTANRYLDMMTNGRYSLDPDPRLEEIVIKDSVQHKTSRQWSSGLGDQVYLSIKMAVAKEMGSERLPMILDDILVRFDQERRRGACAAILDFAKDQQVFLFSCDSTVEQAFPPGTVLNKVGL